MRVYAIISGDGYSESKIHEPMYLSKESADKRYREMVANGEVSVSITDIYSFEVEE